MEEGNVLYVDSPVTVSLDMEGDTECLLRRTLK